MILCGLDECGRGALAGPLVAAGVVLEVDPQILISHSPVPIDDSKKLSFKQREELVGYLKSSGVKAEIMSVEVEDINSRGIGWANIHIFEQIIGKLNADKYVVDGNLKIPSPIGREVVSMVKADAHVLEVMIASILAKVYRDRLMINLHETFPHYDWSSNMGYGTPRHLEGLRLHGSCDHHRSLFVNTALKKH